MENQNNQNNQNTLNIQNTQSAPNNPHSPPTTFLPQHGHYRNLRVYQVAEIIYDITYHFTQHYLAKGDRTVDQMVQAARSGKQNISEGNQAAATSSETEIKLTNVAKASLEELSTTTKTISVCAGSRNGTPFTHDMRRCGNMHEASR